MKYIKGFAGLGLVALGGFIGYHFSLGGVGNAALLGGILACILYYIVIRLGPKLKSRFWPDSTVQNEENRIYTIEQGKTLDTAVRKAQEAAQEAAMRQWKGTR